VSKSLPEVGSLASLPFVTVWGTESLLVAWMESPFLTVTVVGSKAGFPWVEAPTRIDSLAPIGDVTAEVEEAPVLALPADVLLAALLDPTAPAVDACEGALADAVAGRTNNCALIL
jgi:hypothetical protein